MHWILKQIKRSFCFVLTLCMVLSGAGFTAKAEQGVGDQWTMQDTKQLQAQLKELGYYTASCDGIFGSLTLEALLAFQKNHSLPQSGTVCTDTAAALEAALRGELKTGEIFIGAHVPQQRFILNVQFGHYDALDDHLYLEEGENAGISIFDTVTGRIVPYAALPDSVCFKVFPGTSFVTLSAETSASFGPGSIHYMPVTASSPGSGKIALTNGTTILDEINVTVLDFRRFAHSVALLYDEYHQSKGGINLFQYYYEASDIKYDFDGRFYEKDLAFNTRNGKKDHYEQEAKEAFLMMLMQNIQAKELEMQSLTPEQRANFFPGIVFEASSGTWTVNDQVILIEQMAAEDLGAGIDEQINAMHKTAIQTLVDTVLMENNLSSGDKLLDAVTNVVEKTWTLWKTIQHEETKKLIKNAYRQTMIADLKAAQENIDLQVYSALMELESQMAARKESLMQDERILLEVLQVVLTKREEGRNAEEYLQRMVTVQGERMTLNQALDIAAEEIVNELGMPEEIPLTWQEKHNMVLLKIVVESLREGMKVFFEPKKAFESVVGELLIDNSMDTLFSQASTYTLDMDTDNSDTVSSNEFSDWLVGFIFNDAAVSETLIEILDQKVLDINLSEVDVDKQIERHCKVLKQDQAILDLFLENQPDSPSVQDISEHMEKYTQRLNRWKEMKINSEFFGNLIGNTWDFVKSVAVMFTGNESLTDLFKSETLYSCIASSMYRAKQLAETTRASLIKRSTLYVDFENVRNASLQDLRTFVEDVYLVFNTDLTGHAYYTSLAMSFEYETDFLARLAEHGEEADDIIDQTWDQADNILEKSSYILMYVPYYLAWYQTAISMSFAVSDYLELVESKSTLDSWVNQDVCKRIYDSIAECVKRTKIPEQYDILFN